MYNDFVQLCAQLVPTFKNDNVGKEIPKSIIKERLKTLNRAFQIWHGSIQHFQICTTKNVSQEKCWLNTTAKYMLFHMQHWTAQMPTSTNILCNWKRKMYKKRYLISFCRGWATPIRWLAFPFCSGSLCSTGCSSILHLQNNQNDASS